MPCASNRAAAVEPIAPVDTDELLADAAEEEMEEDAALEVPEDDDALLEVEDALAAEDELLEVLEDDAVPATEDELLDAPTLEDETLDEESMLADELLDAELLSADPADDEIELAVADAAELSLLPAPPQADSAVSSDSITTCEIVLLIFVCMVVTIVSPNHPMGLLVQLSCDRPRVGGMVELKMVGIFS